MTIDRETSMDTNNLIDFFIVGKTAKTNETRFLSVKKTEKGWHQDSSHSDRCYDFDYISREQIPDLMNWFKCDFKHYRMFTNREDAQEYLQNDLGALAQKDEVS